MNKFKKFLKKITKPTPLDKIIIGKAKPLDTEKLEGNMVLEVNDKIYREQMSDPQIFRWNQTFLAALCFSPMIFIFLKNDSILLNIVSTIVYLCICIAMGGYAFITPYEELILNREEGTISIHKPYKKDNIIIPFEEGDGFLDLTGPSIGPYYILKFSFKDKPFEGGTLADLYLEEFWDFVVWYMDKNRPLPPGTAFDPYREADFQRRKAEGFPKPLYKSYIPTPEATRRQQLERERIGKW